MKLLSIFRSKAEQNDLKLEYLTIFKRVGIPIYSRCFSDFCQILIKNDVLLTGYLAALNTLPEIIEQKDTVNSIEMGKSKLIFFNREMNDYVVVVGFPIEQYDANQHSHLVNGFFDDIEDLMNSKYLNQNWNSLSNDEFFAFEKELYIGIIEPWFEVTHTNDTCPAGDNCPFRIAQLRDLGTGTKIWDSLRSIYSIIRNKSSTAQVSLGA